MALLSSTLLSIPAGRAVLFIFFKALWPTSQPLKNCWVTSDSGLFLLYIPSDWVRHGSNLWKKRVAGTGWQAGPWYFFLICFSGFSLTVLFQNLQNRCRQNTGGPDMLLNPNRYKLNSSTNSFMWFSKLRRKPWGWSLDPWNWKYAF